MNNHASSSLYIVFRKITNVFMLSLCVLAACSAMLVIGLVLFFLISKGFHALNWRLFTQVPNHDDESLGGIKQSIFGTLTLLSVASLIGLPFGILGGIYQVEARGRFASMVRFFTDVLNGVPSIVIGIFVYTVWVLRVAAVHPGTGYSAYAGGFALGIMMIPTVMRTTEEMLKLVPTAMREASLALGATRWRTMWSVILPAARGGVITGVMLALARIAGETAPLLFTILGTEYFDTHRVSMPFGLHASVPNLNAPIDALPKRIYDYATQIDPVQNQMAWAGSVVLILIILILSVIARVATKSKFLEER